jgi:hypothetical protein
VKVLLLVCIGGFLISPPAMADIVENVSFTYTDPAAGNLMASGTLAFDTTTGQLLSGTGTVTSTLFLTPSGSPLGPQSMTLVTLASPNIRNIDAYGPGTFMYVDSDGTQLFPVDTSFSLTAPYVDTNGLAFAWGAPSAHGTYGSFAIWSQGTGQPWVDFVGHGGVDEQHGQVWQESFDGTLAIGQTLTISQVPEPESAALLLAGLGVMAVIGRLATPRSNNPAR